MRERQRGRDRDRQTDRQTEIMGYKSAGDNNDDDDVWLHVLGCRVDILGYRRQMGDWLRKVQIRRGTVTFYGSKIETSEFTL